MNGATKDDLINDCREAFKVVGTLNGYGDTESFAEWIKKLNTSQLEKLSTFLDYTLDELRS